jgi:nucleoside-triphosphatase
MTGARVLLLTGAPGVGKTTIIRRVAERLTGRHIAGFYTEEIRARGGREGFRLTTFDGRDVVMAHVKLRTNARVGRYAVDVAAIDAAALTALRPDEAVELYMVDEIGKMECLSTQFVTAMRRLLQSSQPVVATVALKGPPFVEEVKTGRGVELWHITRENRDQLPAAVMRWLAPALRG